MDMKLIYVKLDTLTMIIHNLLYVVFTIYLGRANGERHISQRLVQIRITTTRKSTKEQRRINLRYGSSLN